MGGWTKSREEWDSASLGTSIPKQEKLEIQCNQSSMERHRKTKMMMKLFLCRAHSKSSGIMRKTQLPYGASARIRKLIMGNVISQT